MSLLLLSCSSTKGGAMRYRPSRGGHAPGHLRDAFEESAPGNYPIAGPRELDLEQLVGEDVFYDGPRTLRWLIGQLNCTDTMPCDLCEWLGLDQGSSYAQGAR